MAYKFQYGDAVYSGSLNIETNLTGSKVSLGTANSAASVARGTLDLSDADGASYGVKLGGTLVTATAAELNLLDGSSAGTVANSKAVIYSAAGIVQGTDFKGPDGFGIANASVSDFLLFNAAEIVVKDGALDFDIASHDTSNGLKLGGTLVSSTAAEINLLDGSSAGSVVASKAAIYSAGGDLYGTQVSSSFGLSGSSITLEGTAVTAEAADLNLAQGMAESTGTAAASAFVALDEDKSVTGISNLTASFFSGDGSGLSNVTATASPAGSNTQVQFNQNGSTAGDSGLVYDGSGSLDLVEFSAGAIGLKLAGTLVSSTAAELNYVDVTAGTATLSKALVLDADTSIGTILNLTASAAKLTTVDINGGAIDGAVIGAASAVSGTFTGVVATSLSISDGAISNVSDISLDTISADDGSSFSFASNWTAASRTCADLGTVTTADINGGTVDGTTIGVSSAAVVTASYLAVNGNVDLGNGSDVINIGSGGSDTLYLNAMANFEAGAAYNMQSITSNDTLSSGDFYNIVSGSGAITVTLPNVNNIDDGTMFHVKRAYGMENDVTVASGSGQNSIDGEALVVLESELAAISLLWDSNAGVWHIF